MQTHVLEENKDYLTTQIITYIGNKRSLIKNIEEEILVITKELNQQKLVCADIFSGSGIVARMMKKYSRTLIANDLENYSSVINSCYLTNKSEYPESLYTQLLEQIQNECNQHKYEGIITQNYAAKDDNNIQKGERVFYTHQNALLIDTYRTLIDKVITQEELKRFFLAPLITQASIHVNTSGVFKGFYKDKQGKGCYGGVGKNALSRILGKIELKTPIFSNFECPVYVLRKDAVALAHDLEPTDIVYLDPPYNQHPYGSNYFMLNTILENRITAPISKVSGIVSDWNRSVFNKKKTALASLEEIVASLRAQYVVVSYNSEGFITYDEMISMLKKYGELTTREILYNTFRGSRNLSNRNIHVSEYLFTIKKY